MHNRNKTLELTEHDTLASSAKVDSHIVTVYPVAETYIIQNELKILFLDDKDSLLLSLEIPMSQ